MVSNTSRNGGAVMIGLNRRRTMGGKQEKVVPSEYQRLEYITVGTATYFKTGFIPTMGCKVEVTIKGTTANSTKAGTIFGYRRGWNNNSFYLRSSVSSGSQTTMTMLAGYGTERQVTVDIDAIDKNTYGVDNGKFYVNDIILGTYTNTISPTQELYILRCNQEGTVTFNSPNGNLYKAQIWDDNKNLVRDYIPAKRLSDNIQGLYDFVNDIFTLPAYY